MWQPQRDLQPELMDNPGIPASLHRSALEGIGRVNLFSRTDAILWRALRSVSPSRPHQPLTILDIASGGGDSSIRLAQRFQRSGIPVEIEGSDISPTAIEYAREQAKQRGVTQVKFTLHDVLKETLPDRGWDVVMCSLFLHHLSSEDGLALLKTMRRAARQLVIVDDLRRTRLGYWMAWLGCRILTRSPIVHVDGPLSVAGALTSQEALDLAHQAGWQKPQLKNHFPQRFLLSSRIDG